VSRRTRRHRGLLAIGVVLVTVAACTEPDLADSAPPPTETDDVLSEPALNPARDELLEVLETLTATVTAAQAELDTAAGSDNDAAARAAAEAALALLLDDPERLSTDDLALFPARATERGDPAERDDLLSVSLTAAREAGGPLGRATVEVLREPVAGDLGSWERDAEGVVASAAAAVQGARDVDAIADQVLMLPADGLRALAWTFLATETRDADVTRAAAGRASAHLAVVLIGIGLLDTADEATDSAADGDDVTDPDATDDEDAP
jgi:hypothetical protein